MINLHLTKITKFIDLENMELYGSLLCPVVTLRAYEDRTEKNRDDNESQLFIETCDFINHSKMDKICTDKVRYSTLFGAVSSAASAGMTTNDILSAADWSSESVIQKFYFKTVKNSTFGSTLSATGK